MSGKTPLESAELKRDLTELKPPESDASQAATFFWTRWDSDQINRLGERISPPFPCRFAITEAATNATADRTT